MWCGERDSNSHALRRWNLNPVRLPIPPSPHTPRQAKRRALYTRRLASRRAGIDARRIRSAHSRLPPLLHAPTETAPVPAGVPAAANRACGMATSPLASTPLSRLPALLHWTEPRRLLQERRRPRMRRMVITRAAAAASARSPGSAHRRRCAQKPPGQSWPHSTARVPAVPRRALRGRCAPA